MKTLLLAALVLCTITTKATNYYFSTASGNDTRTPVEAKNPATPWKTTGKLNAIFSTLQPGDSILFKRGETFYGSITTAKSGTTGSPIVIGAYGIGNKPIITSLVTLTNWVSAGNGVWESFNSSLIASPEIVLLNGTQEEEGRYPNSDAANDGYLIFESHVGKTSITDNELNMSTDWAGAELVTRSRRWVLERNKITSNSGNTISYTSNSTGNEPYDKMGYFIQNSTKTLDKLGEWYYNPATKKLSVYFGSNAPTSYVIQASTIDNLIYSLGFSNVTFDNLTIKGANGTSCMLKGGSNIDMKNCDILFSGQSGVEAISTDKFEIENCTVSNSNDKGINLGYSSNFAIVKNNKILNTSLIAGMTGVDGIGVYSFGNGNLIEGNQIRNTGYSGIYFNGNDVTIKNNFIDSFCLVKDDGAGIYTHGSDVISYRRKITGNIIMDGVGAGPGTDNPTYLPVSGVYMDNDASWVEITGNTLANCNKDGMFIHNAFGITISNNTFYNNTKQLTMIHDLGDEPIRNAVVTNNILFSKHASQAVTYLKSAEDDLGLFGRFDSNYYARPLDDRITIFNQYVKSSGSGVVQNFDLQGWKDKYNEDKHSKKTAKQIASYRLNSLIGSTKVGNGLFTTNVNGVKSASCISSLGTAGLLDGGYLQVVPSAKTSNVYTSIGGITAGKKYILKYSVRGSVDSSMVISTFLRQELSPYAGLTPLQSREVSLNRTENEIMFLAPSTQSSATVVFQVNEQSKYYLDNIQVYEADATITNIDDSLRFEYNTTNIAKSVSLNGTYINAKGDIYSNSIVLPPYTSAILIKTNGGVQNTAPTVSITSPSVNASFIAPASITISATAADVDGSVTKVDFYNGTTLLGSDNTSPYTFTWDSVATGNYALIAKATDNGGLTSTDTVVSVIKANVAPTVSITSPSASANFITPTSITINATAEDADGSVTKVDFYNSTTLLGSDNTSPYAFTWDNVAPGNYAITAKATDNGGLITSSSVVTISVKANVAPTVSLTSPSAGASFITPTSITISATAEDADGSVAKVDFYDGNILMGSDNTSPYTFTWDNVAPGNYAFTAKATDIGGLITSSSVVTVSVKANVAPTVSLTSPSANANFITPTSITISAAAADADGSVTKVDFYNGTTLLGSDNTSPYTLTWDNVAPGNYAFTAKATDDGGLITSSSVVTVSVKANAAPTVSLTSPSAGSSFITPTSITISAAADDADGSVTGVDFYNGNTLLGSDNTSPYTFTWDNVAPGNYTLTAKATDNGGLISSSTAVSVSVKANAAPTVSLTSPSAGANFITPTSINISAAAIDADGSVTKVDFYDGNILMGSDNTSPYTFTWDNVAPGNYTLTAKATDNGGLVSLSSLVTISVKANIAPTVSITSPSAGASFITPTSITISAAADDADGSVTKVDFYDGNTLMGSDNTSPYMFTWDNVAPGNYTLTAKATDNGGLITSSSVVTVSVKANVAPTVSLTSPSANANFITPTSITISAAADDVDGSVTKVDFYNGNILMGSDNTSPYTFTWDNVAPGNYTFTAKATDNGGLISSSTAVTVSVKANVAPTVSLTSPSANANFITPTSITISAAADDADGSVIKVDFYDGNTLLGSDNTSPYTLTWDNVAPGNYTLTAKATDNGGLITSSTAVTVSVKANVAPTVSITSPSAGASFITPTSITINATAEDADGSVVKVDFYEGNILMGSDNTSPYTFTWDNVAPGSYALTAKATDNGGLITSSTAVTVSVKANVAPTVSLTSPSAGASFITPTSITISAAAADADGSVTGVDFYNGNTLLGSDNTSPYTFTWDNVAPGNYALTAKATDNGGLVSSSTAVTVSVKANVAPTVSLPSPSAGASFITPTSIAISAVADDADGSVIKVDFYDGTTLLGSDNTSPYTFIWDNVAPGNYTLTAKATDNSGLVSSSTAVTVSVKANVAPTVSITSPSISAIFKKGAIIDISADAADIDGSISKVEFYNGNTLLVADYTSPYSFNWNSVPAGNYTLTAKATDNGGKVTSSSAITFSVVNNLAPAVKIINPVGNAIFNAPANVNIEAVANDPDGRIIKVAFFMDTTLIVTEYSFPYTCSLQNLPAGNYTITAKAYDNYGSATTSTPVIVVVSSPILANNLTSPNITRTSGSAKNDLALLRNEHKNISKNYLEAVSIKIGPNPTKDVLSIFANGLAKNKELKISVLSMSGNLIKTFMANTDNKVIQINVSSLKAGIYIIKIASEDNLVYKQFEKQ